MNEGFLIQTPSSTGTSDIYQVALEYGFEGTKEDFYTYLGKIWNTVYKDMVGIENGIASLGDDGKVPYYQLPDFIKASEKGTAGGVASLGEDGKISADQLPSGIGGGGVGESTTGETVTLGKPIFSSFQTETVTCGPGTEIFNAYEDNDYGNRNIAAGEYSSASGVNSVANGIAAFAFGYTANAEGQGAICLGENLFASGDGAVAIGVMSGAYGLRSVAIGNNNHVGRTTTFDGTYKQAEYSVAIGDGNFTYDNNTYMLGNGNVSVVYDTEGNSDETNETYNVLIGHYNQIYKKNCNVLLGDSNTITGSTNYAIGKGNSVGYVSGNMSTIIETNDSLALGTNNKINQSATGNHNYAIGESNTIESTYNYAMGYNNTIPSGNNNYVIGVGNKVDASLSESTAIQPYQNFIAGEYNTVGSNRGVILGDGNTTHSSWNIAIGYGNEATGNSAVAIGAAAKATGEFSFAVHEGKALGIHSTAIGMSASANGNYSMAILGSTTGGYSVGIGYFSNATGLYATSFGGTASGESSLTTGSVTKANNYASVAIGKFNKDMTTGATIDTTAGDVFVIGNGHKVYGTNNPPQYYSNAFRVTYNGSTYGLSAFNSTGADYAEYFEWLDNNPNAEDRVGHFVAMVDDKIILANPNDYILGIVSGQPCIIGNSDEDWLGRWEHDEFGRFVKEYLKEVKTEIEPPEDEEQKKELIVQHEIEEREGKFYKIETEVVDYETPLWRYKANPDYDPNQPYVERKDRKEWSAIGMLGVLSVRDDGTCSPNSYCKVADGGIATSANEYVPGHTWRVIKRLSDDVVQIVFR